VTEPKRVFFDTNVVLYAISADGTKAQIAEDLVASGGTVSVQVLNEFARIGLRKYGMGMSHVRTGLAALRGLCDVRPIDVETHELGLDLMERYQLGLFDAMIVAAALRAECTTLYTGDMQAGQKIGRLTIRNPFG
jgi:predicted nucleic acid-binding protein